MSRLVAAVGALILAAASACSGTHQTAATPTTSVQAPATLKAVLTTAPAPATATTTPPTPTSASATQGPFTVTTTLDRRSSLPARIHWYASTTLPVVQISEMEFLVDGRVLWVEHSSPYSFADDGGYLVTSWLKPGSHRFVARATTTDGQTASDVDVATVSEAPAVPPALAGSWRRTVTNAAAAPAAGSSGNPTDTLTPGGTYTIAFDRKWITTTFPCDDSPCTYDGTTGAGTIFDSDWTPGAKTFWVGGEVTFDQPPDTARRSGWWCETAGPSANYRWSVSGNTLTLEPVTGHDKCGIRGFVWAGTWTRVG